jgi:WD40 repeat protein
MGHKDSVLCIALTKDEKQIISRSRDRTIKIWNFDEEKWSCIRTIPAVSGVVDSLSLNKENNELVFGCKQNLVIWR